MKNVGYIFLVVFGAAFSQEMCPSADEISNVCMNPCQPTCAQPTPPLSSPSCRSNTCEQGCMCKSHLLRDTESGLCIPPSDCPKESVSAPTCKGENEIFNTCASCSRTCQSSCDPPSGCAAVCYERCDCKVGFIRDENLSKCVHSYECPKCKCGENEFWTYCKDRCEETCSSLKRPRDCISAAVCSPGCMCTRGYVRNERTGLCVLKNRCPP